MDRWKRTNDITSLHSQSHHGLTDRRPRTWRTDAEVNNQRLVPSTDGKQLTLTLKITNAQVVETPVTVNNSPIK